MSKLDQLFELSPDAIVLEDADHRVVRVNREFSRMFGYGADEAVGRNLADLIVPHEFRDELLEKQQLTGAGQRVERETVRRHKNGVRLNVSVVAAPVVLSGGQPAIVLAYRDITPRKRAEELLRRSQAALTEGERLSQTGSAAWDLVTGEMFWSEELCRMLGYDPGKVTPSIDLFLQRVHPDDRALFTRDRKKIARTRLTDTELHYRIVLADGSTRYIHGVVHPRFNDAGQTVELYGVCVDETERKRTESLLEGQATVLEMVTRSAPLHGVLDTLVHVIEAQADGMLCSVLFLNKDGLHVRHGAAPSLPKSYTDAINGAAIGPEAGSCGTAAFRGETVIVKDIANDPLWASWRELALKHGLRSCWSTPIRAPSGKVLGMFAMYYREVRTPQPVELKLIEVAAHLAGIAIERRQAEESLRSSQQLLQDIVDSSHALVYVKDTEGRYLLANRRFSELFHIGREEVVGKTDYDFFPAEYADSYRRTDQQALTTGTFCELEENVKINGEEHVYLTLKNPLQDQEGKLFAVCGFSTDITERKRLEEQLRDAQKMEAVGRLAGGIAHDFNNLMTVVTGYSELLRGALASNPELRDKVEEIHKAGNQAVALTRQLLAFSRRQVLQPKLVNLNEVLEHMSSMLRRVLSEDVELKLSADPALALIRSDRGQIEQVIMNLIINARDAMPIDGRITIATANSTWGDEGMKPPPRENPSCVRLMVSDTGQGMDPTTKSRMFEPFFTTKEQGKGTGLGLATVYGIVQQAGGTISVRSEPGRGTTFYIYFPRVEGEVAAEAPLPHATPVRGSETILVVEDQEGLRALTSEVLRQHGYRVLTAPEGQRALGILQQHSEAVNLLITDLVMPLMGGRELAQRVPQLHPETKLLYISGYFEDQGELLQSGLALLEKPFSPEALLRKVREVLNSPVNLPRTA